MQRLKVNLPDAALIDTCMRLAAHNPARQKLAVALLLAEQRWPAQPASTQRRVGHG